MPDFDTRVGAYGVIVERNRVLLAHWNAMGTTNWTLPGGGLEAGEDTESAARREILEETGYEVRLESILGTDSEHFPPQPGRPRPLHSLRIVYMCRITGGELRHEVGGTTDAACWFELDEVERLERVSLVDVGLRWWRLSQRTKPVPGTSPASGRGR